MSSVKSIIESIGSYLPPKQVSTRDVLAGCVNEVRVPLERLTGIRSRHFAGDDEFSIDLSRQAVADCLATSQLTPADYDMVVCCNISRWDAPNVVTYEPSTAARIKQAFGFENAVAFDISNACAGMWTGVYIVDSLIRAGAIRHAMVISGEYISHLTRVAQKEIVDYLDPQLASLTLGDAGVAVSLTGTTREDLGFQDIELYTLSAYSRFCIAKPTDKPHGGAAMHTDAVKVTASVVPHAASHAVQVMERNKVPLPQINHIVPHQTSRLTMQDALKEIASRFQSECDDQLVNNLAERGNTASTSHFLALKDSIQNERIRSGDKILFAISGSGQTTGTALYNCDDLPDRVTGNLGDSLTKKRDDEVEIGGSLSMPFQIEAVHLAQPAAGEKADSLKLLAAAASGCLEKASVPKEQIQLLISAGVYSSDFLTEPAIAALLAGDLKLNDNREPEDEAKTFAFDLRNGNVGFLNACHLVQGMAAAGRVDTAMVVTADVENNADVRPDDLIGIQEMAGALLIRESEDGETGFQAFAFDQYDAELEDLVVRGGWNEQGKAFLRIEISPEIQSLFLRCIRTSVEKFLSEEAVQWDEVDFVLPPQISKAFVTQLADTLSCEPTKFVSVADTLDLASASTPASFAKAMELAQPGQLGLVIACGSGLQVGCALYRF